MFSCIYFGTHVENNPRYSTIPLKLSFLFSQKFWHKDLLSYQFHFWYERSSIILLFYWLYLLRKLKQAFLSFFLEQGRRHRQKEFIEPTTPEVITIQGQSKCQSMFLTLFWVFLADILQICGTTQYHWETLSVDCRGGILQILFLYLCSEVWLKLWLCFEGFLLVRDCWEGKISWNEDPWKSLRTYLFSRGHQSR